MCCCRNSHVTNSEIKFRALLHAHRIDKMFQIECVECNKHYVPFFNVSVFPQFLNNNWREYVRYHLVHADVYRQGATTGAAMNTVSVITPTLFWDITQRSATIPYRRFGTTYKSHPQESRKVGMFIDS